MYTKQSKLKVVKLIELDNKCKTAASCKAALFAVIPPTVRLMKISLQYIARLRCYLQTSEQMMFCLRRSADNAMTSSWSACEVP